MNPDDGAFPMQDSQWFGLTKRELLAAIALNGILAANAQAMEEVNDVNVDYVVAREAVASADALIAELAKKRKP